VPEKLIAASTKAKTYMIAEELVRDIDRIRDSIGVDRSALIKIWLHERVQKEKTAASKG
jgi:metal-responsive CopG/Arc/MetJ family transcriptional regulator